MNDYEKKRRRFQAFLSGIFLILLAMVGCFPLGRRIVSAAYRPFGSMLRLAGMLCEDGYSRLFPDSRHRRETLECQLREAQAKLQETEALREENRQLRQLLKIEVPASWHALSASVQRRDPARWEDAFWIDKGEEEGIRLGDGVLESEALIGRVTELFHHTAKVSTIWSTECRFSVYVRHEQSVFPGVFQGKGVCGSQRSCGVDFLATTAELHPGDTVFSSDLGTQLPYGVPVGVVAPQVPCPKLIDNARAFVVVTPVHTAEKIRFVVVLTRR